MESYEIFKRNILFLIFLLYSQVKTHGNKQKKKKTNANYTFYLQLVELRQLITESPKYIPEDGCVLLDRKHKHSLFFFSSPRCIYQND